VQSTNPDYYWNQRSFSHTNPEYRTSAFKKAFITACIDTATIINHANDEINDDAVDSDNIDNFIEHTGVDDVLPDECPSGDSSNSFQSKKKIQMFRDIFSDNYNNIVSWNLRPSTLDNIQRMLSCGDPSLGGIMFGCPNCQQSLHFSPFHCGSRFCPSCGYKYNMLRANAMMSKLIDAPHRHVTFTIPEELRFFFRLDRNALNDLFTAVADTLTYVALNCSASLHFQPGFISVLHTFGRDLKWNPHVHVLLCETLLGDNKVSRNFFLPYPLLRKSFRKCLLDRLSARFGKVFSKLINLIYKAHPNGFYVHAPKQNVNTQALIKYIGRYLGRPPIASSRIDSYDGTSVTFHYNSHEDNKLVYSTLPAGDFIQALIVHIPDKNFKMVRYYGFYSSEGARTASLKSHTLKTKVTSSQKKQALQNLKWRQSLIHCFNSDPLECPYCGATMEPIYFNCKGRTWFYPGRSMPDAVDIRYRTMMKTFNRSSA